MEESSRASRSTQDRGGDAGSSPGATISRPVAPLTGWFPAHRVPGDALGGPDGLAPVALIAGGQHRGDDPDRTQRVEKPEGGEEAAAAFAGRLQRPPEAAGAQAHHRLRESGPGPPAGSLEPAQEFL